MAFLWTNILVGKNVYDIFVWPILALIELSQCRFTFRPSNLTVISEPLKKLINVLLPTPVSPSKMMASEKYLSAGIAYIPDLINNLIFFISNCLDDDADIFILIN